MSINKSLPINILLIFVSLITGCAAMHSKPGSTTTVILIRHAEKDEKGILSEKGHEHAKALVGAVKNLGVQEIYSHYQDGKVGDEEGGIITQRRSLVAQV